MFVNVGLFGICELFVIIGLFGDCELFLNMVNMFRNGPPFGFSFSEHMFVNECS